MSRVDSDLEKLKIPPNYDFRRIQGDFVRCKDQHYLDHAAATLYSESQIKSITAELQGNLFGNPHSRHTPSDTATQIIESVRHRILEHFNTSSLEYDVIFTAGATDAIKVVAQNFDWNSTFEALRKGGNSITREVAFQQMMPQEPSQHRGAFVYQRENHTSVLGIRNFAHHFGAGVYSVPTKKLKEILNESDSESNGAEDDGDTGACLPESSVCQKEESADTRRHCLFAYSPQCNFSGAKTPLQWIKKVQNGALNDILKKDPINKDLERSNVKDAHKEDCNPRWFVLLDAAGLVATCPLDLTKWKPDFVNLSFYKIMGYPTGLGCLLVRNRAWELLQKTYYGGGTVQMIDSRKMTLVPRPVLHDRFEDGTLPYLSIIAVRHGFDVILKHTGGMENVKHHVFNLARYGHHSLRSYKHANGEPVAEFYMQDEPWHVDTHGSIINFNLLRSDGSYIGYAQVEKMAALYNIHVRTGCLCNPGACQTYLEISEDKLKRQFQAGHVCGDAHDLIDGQPTGSVRISFGYMSTYKDVDQLLRMISECFVDGPLQIDTTWLTRNSPTPFLKPLEKVHGTPSNTTAEKGKRNSFFNLSRNLSLISHSCKESRIKLTDIIVYPVKSCGGMSVRKWKIVSEGLQYDRKWMIVTDSGVTMTQKRLPQMCLIQPSIDLEGSMLNLSFPGKGKFSLPLDSPPTPCEVEDIPLCGGRVCGDKIKGVDCGQEIGEWLSKVLDKPNLKLMRQTDVRKKKIGQGNEGKMAEDLSLANESQYLLLHLPSIRKLLENIRENGTDDLNEADLVKRFRGNFILDGGGAYEEDSWRSVTMDSINFEVQGGCRRCQMIGVVSDTGERTKEPMLTLGKVRGSSMLFGIYAKLSPPSSERKHDDHDRIITRGANVKVTT